MKTYVMTNLRSVEIKKENRIIDTYEEVFFTVKNDSEYFDKLKETRQKHRDTAMVSVELHSINIDDEQ